MFSNYVVGIIFACSLKPKSLDLCRRLQCDFDSKAFDRSKTAPVPMFHVDGTSVFFSVA